MGFIIGLLTLAMVLDCLLLILLVLIQLPKKEAGVGLAFGGAATDALFGAGSGTVLTKLTKYAAIAFFALSVVLSFIQIKSSHRSSSFLQRLSQPPPTVPVGPSSAAPAPSTTAPNAPAPGAGSNFLKSAPAAEQSQPAHAPATAPVPATPPANAAPQK